MSRSLIRKNFEIAVEGALVLRFQASNWMIALGSALESLGWLIDIESLAMERRPDGVIVVSDLTNQVRFTIRTELEPQLVASA